MEKVIELAEGLGCTASCRDKVASEVVRDVG